MKSFIFYLFVVIALSFTLGVFVSRPLTKRIASSVQQILNWRQISKLQSDVILEICSPETLFFETGKAWYNFKTETYDWIVRPAWGTWKDYIPQHTKSLMLFDFYFIKLLDPEKAMLKVLEVYIGRNR